MTAQVTDLQITHFGPRLEGPPVVSVLMITYNHEAYIREAIESVFAQVTTFPIELVIGEDCSTDGTRQVIEHVCANAPISVKLLTSKTNVGMHVNLLRSMKICDGEFVAMLEGDDYWMVENKLEIQADILSKNKLASMVFHQAIVKYECDERHQRFGANGDSIPLLNVSKLEFADILRQDFFLPTASTMHRRYIVEKIPDWISELPWGDAVLSLMAADRGTIVYLKESMSVYRVTNHGASSGFNYDVMSNGMIRMLQKFYGLTSKKNLNVVRESLLLRFDIYAGFLEKMGRYEELISLLTRQISYEVTNLKVRRKTIKWYLRIQFPSLHSALVSVKGKMV